MNTGTSALEGNLEIDFHNGGEMLPDGACSVEIVGENSDTFAVFRLRYLGR